MNIVPNGNRQSFGKWFLMLLFPPYGFYYFLFKSRVKWFIKIPVSLILVMMIILAVDQSLHPNRVEDAQIEETIAKYIDEHSDMRMGNLRNADRQGAFTWDDQTQLVFRTLTTSGLYDVVVEPKEDQSYEVNAVFQTYPTIGWGTEEAKEKYPTAPMAMLYFYEHQEELGELKDATEDEEVNTIETTKGTFRYGFEKNKVISVQKEDGEIILQQKNEYSMPKEVVEFFEKNKEEWGEVTKVEGYDMDEEKEMYFVKTTNGLYRVDDYRDGNIKLLKEDM